MLSWYSPEIAMPLLFLVGLALLAAGRGRSIWWRNLGGLAFLLFVLHFLFVPNILIRLQSGYTSNVAETGATPLLPELAPIRLSLPPDAAFGAALRAGEGLRHYEVVATDASNGHLRLIVGVPTWSWWPFPPLFIDEMSVQITPVRGGSQLQVHSTSPWAAFDFGANRRHIARFSAAVRRTAPQDR